MEANDQPIIRFFFNGVFYSLEIFFYDFQFILIERLGDVGHQFRCVLYFLHIPHIYGGRAHDDRDCIFERGLEASVCFNKIPSVHTLHIHIKNDKRG